MEYEIAIFCLVLICAAYKVGRAGYEIEKKKSEKSDYDKINDSINDVINEEDKLTRNLVIKTLKSREQKHSKQCPRSGHYPCSPKVTNLVWKGAGGAPDYDYICPECRHEFNNSSF